MTMQVISLKGNNMKSLFRPQEVVEVFHMLFLQKLGKGIPATSYAVKGGCNLRFILGSPRMSEDLDIDIHQVAKHTLQKQMARIVEKELAQPLNAWNIKIHEQTAPKQTDTVQRWKITLLALGERVPTKIEFSRRNFQQPATDSIQTHLLEKYGLPGFAVSHYASVAALKQKLRALAGRPATQARDVFDIVYLLETGARVENIAAETAQKALANLSTLTFKDYASQVLPYLDSAPASQEDIEAVWERMLAQVAGAIDAIPKTEIEREEA